MCVILIIIAFLLGMIFQEYLQARKDAAKNRICAKCRKEWRCLVACPEFIEEDFHEPT